MTDRERVLLRRVLSRLFKAVEDLDGESTFRNIDHGERTEMNRMIGELCGETDGHRIDYPCGEGNVERYGAVCSCGAKFDHPVDEAFMAHIKEAAK